MQAPFTYGKIAGGSDFTDREKETQRLVQNFSNRINTMLVSPRRWGKSSLVRHAAEIIERKNKKIRICHIDLFNVRTEKEFYELLVRNILKSVSDKWEKTLQETSGLFRRILPKFSFTPSAETDFSVSLDWNEVQRHPEEILNLPEVLSIKKGIQIVICMDEFQNIAYYENPVAFQKKLRAQWQNHKTASYCLFGSKRHMLLDFFTNPSMPFYKFGDLLFLEKIPTLYWIPFIRNRFSDTGKKIDESKAERIAAAMENHPYFVQQLAQSVWFNTDKECTNEVISESIETLLLQYSILFQREVDQLTNPQVNFLKALCDGVTRFSAAETLIQYQLGTSGNVNRIKQALEGKEIIDPVGSHVTFMDPLLKSWLEKMYFRI